MKNVIKMSLATVIVMGMGSVCAQAQEGVSVFSDVKFKGELRPRYQFTDKEATAASAGHTFTNRTNLNIEAKLFETDGLKTTLELNSVNDFNSLDKSNSDLAAEAAVAKMTQANISYSVDSITGIVGRKTVNLDNQRFVGSVGWKQNFQTLDLAALSYSQDALSVLAAYVYGVNAIADAGNGTAGVNYTGGTASGETTSAVINASYKIADTIKVTAYGYLLGSHSDTYGLAASGKIPVTEGVKLDYRAEYAMQSKASLETSNLGKPTNVDSSYINLDVSTNLDGILLGLNYEVLGAGNNTGDKSFQTPLATKHKFNGWADLFLVTPTAGLVDMNVMAGYKSKDFGTAKAIYHSFDSDKGSVNYGSELDLIYTNAIPGFSSVMGMLKAGMYMAGDSVAAGNPAAQASDVTKVWLMLDYKFSI